MPTKACGITSQAFFFGETIPQSIFVNHASPTTTQSLPTSPDFMRYFFSSAPNVAFSRDNWMKPLQRQRAFSRHLSISCNKIGQAHQMSHCREIFFKRIRYRAASSTRNQSAFSTRDQLASSALPPSLRSEPIGLIFGLLYTEPHASSDLNKKVARINPCHLSPMGEWKLKHREQISASTCFAREPSGIRNPCPGESGSRKSA